MSFLKSVTAVLTALFIVATTTLSHGQTTPPAGIKETGPPEKTEKADSLKNAAAKAKIRRYSEVITAKALTRKGMFTIHQIEDKYYFELPLSLFKRDVLLINRIAEAPVDLRQGNSTSGFAGDPIGGYVIHFEKGPSDKIFIRKISYTEYSPDSTSAMYQAVKRNTVQPIVASLPIACYKPDSSAVVVDVTSLINSDNEIFDFGQMEKMIYHLGAFQADKSYIHYMRAFPENIEIRKVRTYILNGGTRGGSGVVTMETNSSLVLLPEKPMKPRYYDERVGFFTTNYVDYDKNPQGVEEINMVNRWRLEPKPEDMDKYNRGELVEPKKQIVFYIDRATPGKWVPYLIQGVKDWDKAFEKAGFKNAITARLAPSPQEDPSFDLDDARHSALVYKPSVVANASGPSITDPRSGEIMESHINWYHNVMKLVHNWYMIQCGAVDPRARKMEFDDELMGQLIRFISSHEVGHTLGLRHNFGSSSTVPVEKLRDNAWLEANGHTPSIMDYARFNYVAQPEDHISEKGLFPRIGDYDVWAIEWGYKYFGEQTSLSKETSLLSKLTTEKQKNPRLWFGSEIALTDPRCQNEDLGDNSMKASEYGIRNLKRILPQLESWTKTPEHDYDDLKSLYLMLNSQFDRYAMHVLKNVAGVMVTPKTVEQPGPVYVPVDSAKQEEAMQYLDRNIFTYPGWMYDRSIMDKIGIDFLPLQYDRQKGVLESLINPYKLSRLMSQEAVGTPHAFTAGRIFTDINEMIFRPLHQHRAMNAYERNFQKIYIDKLVGYVKPSSPNMYFARDNDGPAARVAYNETLDLKESDMLSLMRTQLKFAQKLITACLPKTKSPADKAHLEDLKDRIAKALKIN